LDQYAIAQIEAMIVAATTGHGILVEDAQARRGLTGVQNYGPGARNRVHVAARQSGNAAHALHDIEDHTLARQHHARVVDDDRDRLPFVQPHAVEDFSVAGDLGMRGDGAVQRGEDVKNARDAAYAGEHTVLLGKDGGGGALVGVDARIGGGIAGGTILLQCVFQDCGDPAAFPIHDRYLRATRYLGAKGVGENRVVPERTRQFFPRYPGLTSWADIISPLRGFSFARSLPCYNLER